MYYMKRCNVVFIAHPKTASSATYRAFDTLGSVMFGHHHDVNEQRCKDILGSGGIVTSTVRNPFDLLVSWYFHYMQRRPGGVMESFDEWLPQQLSNPNHYIRQGLFYGLPLTNRVLRFETLQEDFDNLMDELLISRFEVTPFNVSRKREGRPYQGLYTQELVKLVEDKYGDVLDDLGYTYEG